jgi:hypothetical protein
MRIFDNGINNGTDDGKRGSAIRRTEESGNFLFDFEGSYHTFGSVIIRRNIVVVKEAEQMLPVMGQSAEDKPPLKILVHLSHPLHPAQFSLSKFR